MKYKVIRQFKDKNTQQRYLVGSEYETNSWQRAKKLQELGHLGDKIEESKKKKQQSKVTSDNDDA